jgi:hypothetical protein
MCTISLILPSQVSFLTSSSSLDLQHYLLDPRSCSRHFNSCRRRSQARRHLCCSFALARHDGHSPKVHRSCWRCFRSGRLESVLLHSFIHSISAPPDPTDGHTVVSSNSRGSRLRRRYSKRFHQPLGRPQLLLRHAGSALPGRLQQRRPIILDGGV